SGATSGGYTSGLITQTPGVILGHAKEKKPLALLIDGETPNLLPVLAGLQASGAKIVQVGTLGSSAGVQFHQMLLPDGVRVKLRVREFVSPGGGLSFDPDVQLNNQEGAGERGVRAAIASLNAPAGNRAGTAAITPAIVMRGQSDNPY